MHTYGSVSISNCTFSNNTSSLVGGAVDMEAPAGGGSPMLSIVNSTFTANSATIGGGVNIANTVNGTISNSTFTANTSTGNGGGAIGVNSGSMSLSDVTLTGNQAQGSGNGGAVYTGGGSTTIQYSRIYNNTASAGTPQVFNNVAGATTSAENDWWGVNAGPGSGIANFGVSAWQVLKSTASPNPIEINQTSTITANLDGTNLGGSIAPGNHLPDGIPVGFANGTLGTVSPTSAGLTAGSASTTYTAGGTTGIDGVPTTVDAQTVNASITISPVSQITPAATSCSQFAGGAAPTLSQLKYSTKSGTIHDVSRDGFFYWVTVTSSGGSQTFTITQSPSETSNPFLAAYGTAHTAGCARVAAAITQSGNTVTVKFNGRSAGTTFYIGLKFSTSNVIGEPRPTPNTTVMYLFSTTGVTGSTNEIDLVKR